MRLLAAIGSALCLGCCGLALLGCLLVVAACGGLDFLKPERD